MAVQIVFSWIRFPNTEELNQLLTAVYSFGTRNTDFKVKSNGFGLKKKDLPL